MTNALLKEKTIYSTSSNINYVKMLVPDGWSIKITTYKDIYGGYSYPYVFKIVLTSPDNTAAISYFSPYNFLDDHMVAYNKGQINDYGDLYAPFTSIEDYLDNLTKKHLKDYQFELFQEIEDINMSNRQEKAKERALKKTQEENSILNWHYFKELCRVYKYKKSETQRNRAVSGIIEARDIISYGYVPGAERYMNDPFFVSSMKQVYKDVRYDQNSNKYVYTKMAETLWNARKILIMDCIEKDFEYLYENIFKYIIYHGVTICDDIWQDFETIRKQNNERYAQIRQEKKEVARINRKAQEERNKSNKELYEYVRKTQNEIHDIQKSSYENTRRTQNKISQMWSDVNRGDTRFVDKYGDEHVIHTYNDYAYKSGDTYITSDSPLDHDWDFEELKKKKY